MQINLLLNGNSPILSGYINIDPTAPDDDLSRTNRPLNAFDDLCEDGEATHILANNVCEYFPAKDLSLLVEFWVKKLRHGGKLTLIGTDLLELSRNISNRTIGLDEANFLIYGSQADQYSFKQSVLASGELVKALRGMGLKLTKYKLEHLTYVVEVERP